MIRKLIKLLQVKLNPYLPLWLMCGVIFGIIGYVHLNQFWLISITILLLFLVFIIKQAKIFIITFVIGCLIGCSRLFISSELRKIERQRITMGGIHIIGQIENNGQRKNSISIIYFKDAAGIVHDLRGRKFILCGDIIPEPGQIISCTADAFQIKSGSIPGFDDQRFKLFFQDIIGFAKITSYSSQVAPDSNWLRNKITNVIRTKFTPKIRGLILAILVGNSSEIDPVLYDQMVRLGISHLLVVSAMHFTLFSAIFFLIIRWVIGPIFLPEYLSVQSVARYGVLFASCVYFSIVRHNWSVIRSFFMINLALILPIFRRHLRPFHIVSVCGLAMIIIWPYCIFDLGFQLSFIAVFTLILLKGNLLTSTLFVTLTTAPLVLYNYGYLNLQPFLASITCIPFFSFIIMPLVSLSTLFYFPEPLVIIIQFCIEIFLGMISILDKILILPLYLYITGISFMFALLGLASWVLISSPFVFFVCTLVSIVTAFKYHYPTILIDKGLEEIMFYSNGVLYTTHLDSWKTNVAKKFFNARYILPMPTSIIKENTLYWNNCIIILDKHRKFREIFQNQSLLLKSWDIIGNRSSALIILKPNTAEIKLNN